MGFLDNEIIKNQTRIFRLMFSDQRLDRLPQGFTTKIGIPQQARDAVVLDFIIYQS